MYCLVNAQAILECTSNNLDSLHPDDLDHEVLLRDSANPNDKVNALSAIEATSNYQTSSRDIEQIILLSPRSRVKNCKRKKEDSNIEIEDPSEPNKNDQCSGPKVKTAKFKRVRKDNEKSCKL
jgi:hypothetical protein